VAPRLTIRGRGCFGLHWGSLSIAAGASLSRILAPVARFASPRWTVLARPAGAAPIRPLGVAAAEDWFAVSDVGNRAVHLFDLDDRHLTSLDGTTAGLPVPAYLAGDGDILAVADIVANELRRYRVENDTLTLVDIVRGSSPDRTSILFQRIGGIALGAR
jgi:hypothetical protein